MSELPSSETRCLPMVPLRLGEGAQGRGAIGQVAEGGAVAKVVGCDRSTHLKCDHFRVKLWVVVRMASGAPKT